MPSWHGLTVIGPATNLRILLLAYHVCRHVDRVAVCDNGVLASRTVRESAVPREQIFVTIKLGREDGGHDPALRAIDGNLAELGFDYVYFTRSAEQMARLESFNEQLITDWSPVNAP